MPPRFVGSIVRRSFAAVGLEIRRRRRSAPVPARGKPSSPHLRLNTHVGMLLERYRVELVLDVGGNVGAYGQLLRRVGYRGRIASFEPVSASFSELSMVAAGDPLWSVHNVALGSASGSRTISVMKNNAQSSFLSASHLGRELIATLQVDYEETVEVRRLDELFDEISAPLVGPRTYLKMDTQGFDMEVIAGASGCLDSVVALQTEMSIRALYDGAPPWLAVLGELEHLGFWPTGFYPVGRDANWLLTECDCVMARA